MTPPMVDIHTHRPARRPDVVEWPDGSADGCVGMHPWHISPAGWDDIRRRAAEAQAVGECGLDRRCATPWDVQTEWFVRQIELSAQLGKPLVVHCVRAYDEVARLHRLHPHHPTWIMHGYGSSAEWLMQQGDGIAASFGAAIMHPGKARRALTACPPHRLLLETDTSDVGIAAIYECAARLRGIGTDELRLTVWRNFGQIAGLRTDGSEALF